MIPRSIPTIGRWHNKPDAREGLQPRVIRDVNPIYPLSLCSAESLTC